MRRTLSLSFPLNWRWRRLAFVDEYGLTAATGANGDFPRRRLGRSGRTRFLPLRFRLPGTLPLLSALEFRSALQLWNIFGVFFGA